LKISPNQTGVILNGLQAVKDLAGSRYTLSPCVATDPRQSFGTEGPQDDPAGEGLFRIEPLPIRGLTFSHRGPAAVLVSTSANRVRALRFALSVQRDLTVHLKSPGRSGRNPWSPLTRSPYLFAFRETFRG